MRALGIDVGGTFTDAVLRRGRARSASRRCRPPRGSRTPSSTPPPPWAPRDVDRFTHGTTIATNALLERRGARTALVTNEGFEHVLHLRRQTRAHLYRPCVRPLAAARPARALRRRARAHRPGRRARAARPRHAPGDRRGGDRRLPPLLVPRPEPERRVADELRRRYPSAHVVASHEVAPEFREYERASTTAVDAYLGPVLSRYLGALAGACCRRRAPGAARDALLGRPRDARGGGRARGLRASLRAGRRRRRRGEARRARRLRERALVRHGRHVDGRVRDRRRRGAARARAPRRRLADPPADPRRAHGRRRRRLDRPARRRRRAARRPGERGRRSRPRLLRAGRYAGDGDRREPPARPPAVDAARRHRARHGRRRARAGEPSTRPA